jgi:hypothetical protein
MTEKQEYYFSVMYNDGRATLSKKYETEKECKKAMAVHRGFKGITVLMHKIEKGE